ncbi:MAG: hypothetical protein AAGG11_08320 [Pseudomonadota bacterium]
MTHGAAPAAAAGGDPELLILDTHTRNDLQLFDADPDAPSLFKFCNRCRTDGGALALRRRMDAPWANAERIRATQAAIRFILGHPPVSTHFPAATLINNVQRYGREILPVIRQESPLEFPFAAFALWSQERRFYLRIGRGVVFTVRLLHAVHQFLEPLRDADSAGDLTALLKEMARLLDEDLMPAAQQAERGFWFWSTLRVDQAFRLRKREALERLLELLFEVDALIAMAAVSGEPGYSLPEISSGSLKIAAAGLRHPLLSAAVPNPLTLDQAQRVLFLTGPNMAGKTTYLRTAATALYFAHLGMGVPAAQFTFVPAQQLLTAISLNDDLLDGISYFRAEALRVKAVAEAIANRKRTVAIMDEPFKGTNVKDAFDASLAILERFADTEQCLFLVSSHLIELAASLEQTGKISFRYFEANETGDRLSFDYRVHDGLSDQRLGMRVLIEEGIFELLTPKTEPTGD